MPDNVTQILAAIERGDPQATNDLLPLVYQELRRLAARQLSRESPGQTLSPTALVHEAYVRLVDSEHPQGWRSRGHFFAAAAEAMRRILVDNARRKARVKHGGRRARLDLQEGDLVSETPSSDLVALDEALDRFAAEDPEKAQLVKLRYFAGLTLEQAAEALGISRATAARYWSYSRAWLFKAIREA